jgi:hypothetical protein
MCTKYENNYFKVFKLMSKPRVIFFFSFAAQARLLEFAVLAQVSLAWARKGEMGKGA